MSYATYIIDCTVSAIVQNQVGFMALARGRVFHCISEFRTLTSDLNTQVEKQGTIHHGRLS
jgi:hypothetical protein